MQVLQAIEYRTRLADTRAMVAAMVLAAGHGTRLRPLTDELPKPLLPVGDRPQLYHICRSLKSFGAGPIFVNVHHLAGDFVRRVDADGWDVCCIEEFDLRGTAGGLAGARRLFDAESVLVWNGDIVAEPPLAALVKALERAPLAVAVALRARGHGSIGLGEHGRVVRMRGRAFGEEVSGADYIGVAALTREALDSLPTQGCLVGDYALPALERGVSVQAVVHVGDWLDMGTPIRYLQANVSWLAGRPSWTGARVALASSVDLVDSIVGEGASVVGKGELRRVVVWPHSQATAPLQNAVVTPRVVLTL